MKTVFKYVLWLIFSFASFASSAQGLIDGFMKDKGHADIALSGSYEQSDIYYAGPNEISYTRQISSVSLFATYGLTKRLNVVGSIPFINGNLQDGSLSLKAQLYKITLGPFGVHLIGAAGVSGPLSDYVTQSGSAIGQKAISFPGRVMTQISFGKGWFVNFRSGFTYSVEPVPSSVPLSVKLGYARAKWYLDVWADRQYAIGGKDYRGTGNLAAETFRELGVSYLRVGGVVYRSIASRWGAFVGGGHTLDGRNTGKAWRISAGLVYKHT